MSEQTSFFERNCDLLPWEEAKEELPKRIEAYLIETFGTIDEYTGRTLGAIQYTELKVHFMADVRRLEQDIQSAYGAAAVTEITTIANTLLTELKAELTQETKGEKEGTEATIIPFPKPKNR